MRIQLLICISVATQRGYYMKKIKNRIAITLFVVTFTSMSICCNALTYGINTSYALRQLSGVPDSSNVYDVQYSFYASRTTTTMTCTRDTTSGANVLAVSSNGISGLLDVKGLAYSAPAILGDVIVTISSLSVPNSYNTYTGNGTVVG